MIEVGTTERFSVTVGTVAGLECVDDCFLISLEYPTDKVSVYYTKNGQTAVYPSGLRMLKEDFDGIKNTFALESLASYVSTTWDDIVIKLLWEPPCGCACVPCCDLCIGELKLTAYRIEMDVLEKPWGHENWSFPEDQDKYDVNGKERHWYHLWDENENIIWADVEPECLKDIVTDRSYGSLATADFSPNPNVTGWKIIAAGVGEYIPVTATIHIGSETLRGTQMPVDMVINEVEEVAWVERSETITADPETLAAVNLAKLEAFGDGHRTFPEKRGPDTLDAFGNIVESPWYNGIEAKITLAVVIPDRMWGSVYVAWFDPDNPIGSQKTPPGPQGIGFRDNWGYITISNYNPRIEFNAGEKDKTKRFTIFSAHAGDNYIVATHPNTGVVEKYVFLSQDQHNNSHYGIVGRTLLYPEPSVFFGDYTELPQALQTSVLTVWRTLNVECDVMKYHPPGTALNPTEPPNPAEFFVPGTPGISPLPPPDVTAQLARACVVINAILPSTSTAPTLNVTQPPTGSNPLNLEAGEEMNMLNKGRDLYGNSQKFWTVRIIMSSSNNGSGVFYWGEKMNTIVINYEFIKPHVTNWNSNPSHSTEKVTEHDFAAHVILHEICHLLIGSGDIFVYFDNGKFFDLNDNEISDLSSIGVRTNIVRGIPDFDKPPVPDIYHSIMYSHLLIIDIQDIQRYSRAR